MPNLNHSVPLLSLTVAVSGTTSSSGIVQGYDLLGLEIPALDSSTFKVQGSLDGVNFRDVYDEYGSQTLSWAVSTGNRVIGAKGLADLTGLYAIRIVLGSAQNSGQRQFRLLQKQPNRS